MHPLAMTLLKKHPSLLLSSICQSCAGVRTIRTIVPLPRSTSICNSSPRKDLSTRATDGWVVSHGSKDGDRTPDPWRPAPSARFGSAAAAAEKGFGRNLGEGRGVSVEDARYQGADFSDCDKSEGGGVGENQVATRLMTLPTMLTIGRVVAVPFLVTTFYMNNWWATTATTSIFVAAAITDWLDGYIARKMRLGTAFGAFLDPVADKLMVATTLVLLCSKPLEIAIFGQVPWLLTVPSIAIIGREITMSAVREWAASQDSKVLEAVAVNKLGKWKTATQMTALIILLATRDSSLAGPGVLAASGVVLLYVSAGLTVWSLVAYVNKIWRLLLK